jgi:hypothetical protein
MYRLIITLIIALCTNVLFAQNLIDSIQSNLKPVFNDSINTTLNHEVIDNKVSTINQITPIDSNSKVQENTINFTTIEAKTYKQYLEHFWYELIETAKTALKYDIDYYYLRLRIGVAYYQTNQYKLAEKHFIKALEFNDNDPFLKEYLYFTFIHNEHYQQAQKFSIDFDSTLKARTVGNDNPISILNFETGAKLTSNELIFGNASNYQINFGHRLSKYLSVNHAISRYSQQGFFGNVIQKQYYLNFNIPIKKTWIISPTIHLVNFDLDTAKSKNIKPEQRTFISKNGFVSALNIKKSFTYFDINLNYAYSTLNDSTQNQESINLIIYPFSNRKFNVGFTSIFQQRNENKINGNGYIISSSYRHNSKLKLDAAFYWGNLRNYNEENGYVINNSFYTTTNKLSIIPQIEISKKIDLYIVYQFENKALYNYSLHFNNIFLGLKYKF